MKPLLHNEITMKNRSLESAVPIGSGAEAFARMRAIVEAPGYPLLTDYRQDFYTYDKAVIEREWHGHARFLWVVRQYGTELVPLGAHPGQVDYGLAALGQARRNTDAKIYLITAAGLEEVDRARAEAEVHRVDYTIKADMVAFHNLYLGSYTLNTWREGGNIKGSVAFYDAPPAAMDPHHAIALLQIARHLVDRTWNSLFAGLAEVTLNGRDLTELVPHQADVSTAKPAVDSTAVTAV